MSTEIFDRDTIVGIIKTNCLEAEPGAGTVILSPQKSGKSHLLDYIYRQRDPTQNTFYCWISVDSLAAKVSQHQRLSDGVFLRYFLKLLQDELSEYLARESEREVARAAEIERDEARLKSGEIEEDDLKTLLEATVAAVRIYLNELNLLRKYRDNITVLIGDASEDALYEFVDEFLDKLKRLKKRLVIFIDDVHKIVGNHDFSERLLSLLRGASSDGKLVPLLATPLQLMHSSLHNRTRGDQTRTLFNDVKVEVLNSFTDDEAISFLNWPKPPDKPLNNEEQDYIISLAGGSPHFLKEVRDRFLRTRPLSVAQRKTFEQDLGQALAAAFETVWTRCGQDHKDAVRAVKAGKAKVLEVDLGPAECFVGPQGTGFARLFETFLVAKKDDEPDFLQVSAAPAFRIFPTALCIANPDALRPLVTITISNPTQKAAKVKLECELEQFSLKFFKVVSILSGETINVPLQVTLIRRAGVDLANPESTQIRWKAELNPGSAYSLIDEATIFVRVLAMDQFVFASRDEIENKLLNYSWLIGAWVNAQDPAVRQLANKASAELAKRGIKTSGYAPTSGPAEEEAVEAQVEELYKALRDREGGITYQNRSGAPFTDRKSFSQRVRLPGRSLAEGCANCLDGAVLFSSLLAAMDLDPVILFQPDHSLVGWKTARGAAGELKFLEITDVADKAKNFADALNSGMSRYEKVKDLVRETPEIEINDIGNFAILVDVRFVQEDLQLGILPHAP